MSALEASILKAVAHHDDDAMQSDSDAHLSDYVDVEELEARGIEYGEDEDAEEVMEEISEAELLELMEQEQDSLLTCRGLFKDPVNGPALDSLDLSSLFSSLSLSSSAHAQASNDIKPEHIRQLFDRGLAVMDGFVSADEVGAFQVAAEGLVQAGRLTMASMVRPDDDPFRARTVRGDEICWIHPGEAGALEPLVNRMLALQTLLAQAIHLQGSCEFQLAHYAANAKGYESHRDAFPTSDPDDPDQRRVTAICYLNPDWNHETQGGALRIHRRDLEQDISPIAGRVVIFMSGVVDHEVLSSSRPRYALTCWMR
ncbi:hypothetical protein BC831DRAFT_526578 [Entophlyctis helioformis]|nr:hypothetical protein BC831DRAFT_526578 [Entophlyctis helioformis]